MNRRETLKTLSTAVLSSAGSQHSAGREIGAPRPLASLPEWVPRPGTVRSIGLNTLADLDPCRQFPCVYSAKMGQRGMFAYSGGTYAKDFGRYGAYVMTGGGHGDYQGNEIYLFPFHERRWIRITDPYPTNGLRRSEGLGRGFDAEFGDHEGSIPEQMHTYDFIDTLPTAAGGGKSGSLIRLIGTACGYKAHNFAATHVCDLETGTWRRYARAIRAGFAGGSAYDLRRKRFYMIVARASSANRSIYYLDTESKRWQEHKNKKAIPVVVESSATIYPPGDLLIYVQTSVSAAPRLWAIPLDLSANDAWMQLRTEGLPPQRPSGSSKGFGLEYCTLDGCFYGVPGDGENRLWKLVPPGRDPLSGTWHWEVQQLTGSIDIGRGRLLYNRLRWVDSLQSFALVHGINGPMQLIRPKV